MLLLPVPKATAPRRQGQSPRKGRSMERADLNPSVCLCRRSLGQLPASSRLLQLSVRRRPGVGCRALPCDPFPGLCWPESPACPLRDQCSSIYFLPFPEVLPPFSVHQEAVESLLLS